MSAFAASTTRIRLGQMSTCMSYRNPAYLVKVAGTVDIVSGGRTEMGIGGGWYEDEGRAYGYGFPSAGDRLRRLDEGVQIMRQAWKTGTASLAGKHYQVDGAIVRPLPLQENGIPLWIAGGGEKVTLKIAAKHAQYTNFAGTPEEFSAKSEILRAHTVADRLAAIEARVAPQGMSERGLGYAIRYFPEAAYDRSGIELFEREVIPALQ